MTVLIVTYLKSKEKLNCGKKSVLFMYMIISNTIFFKKGGSKYLAPPPTLPSQTHNLPSVKIYCRLQWWRNYLILNETFFFLLVGNAYNFFQNSNEMNFCACKIKKYLLIKPLIFNIQGCIKVNH